MYILVGKKQILAQFLQNLLSYLPRKHLQCTSLAGNLTLEHVSIRMLLNDFLRNWTLLYTKNIWPQQDLMQLAICINVSKVMEF